MAVKNDPLGLGEGSVSLSDLSALDDAQKVTTQDATEKRTKQLASMGPTDFAAVDASKARERALAPQGNAIPQAAADQLALNPSNVQVLPAKTPEAAAAAAMAPVAMPAIEKAAPVAMAVQPVKAIDQASPQAVPAPSPAEAKDAQVATKAAEMATQAKEEPKIGQKLLELAKNAGVGLLELIQGFAKGYSGSDLPLASQIREQEKLLKSQQTATAEQQQKALDFQAAQAKADQDFQMRLGNIQQDYQNRMFAATTKKEKDAADQQRAFEQQEAQKEREKDLQIAKMETTFSQQGRQMTRQEQAAAAIKSALAQGQ
jgi:hypothetical protein